RTRVPCTCPPRDPATSCGEGSRGDRWSVHRITIITAFLGALAYLVWEINDVLTTGTAVAVARCVAAAALVVGLGLYLRNLRARLDAKLRPIEPPPADGMKRLATSPVVDLGPTNQRREASHGVHRDRRPSAGEPGLYRRRGRARAPGAPRAHERGAVRGAPRGAGPHTGGA